MQGCQGNPNSGKDRDAMSVVGAPATRRHPSHAEKPVTGAALVHSWQAPPRPTPPQAYRPDSRVFWAPPLPATQGHYSGSICLHNLVVREVNSAQVAQPQPLNCPSPAPAFHLPQPLTCPCLSPTPVPHLS